MASEGPTIVISDLVSGAVAGLAVAMPIGAIGTYLIGLAARERTPLLVPFPAHNFFLLGVRNLLWIFRLVGIWWIWQGMASVLG